MHSHLKAVYQFLYVQDLDASRAFFEQRLGLEVLESDPGAVKYDVGEIMLALNRGCDFGVEVSSKRDGSQLNVFHVNDIDSVRSLLERDGIDFCGDTERYEIGATADFATPDGQTLTLYEPSDEAMSWPSADQIRVILAADTRSRTILRMAEVHNSAGLGSAPIQRPLKHRKLVYIFNFVSDAAASEIFYKDCLGLPVLERDADAGVVKYDAGGVILATHLVGTQPNTPEASAIANRKKSALVFLTWDLRREYERIKAAGVKFLRDPSESGIGTTAMFHDPAGHVFYLYEPSREALSWPSGAKLEALSSSA